MPNHEYEVKVALKGDASGLSSVTSALKDIEDRASSINDISFNVNVTGNAEKTIKNIKGLAEGLKSTDIAINATGNFEQTLKNIEGHLATISKNTTISLQVDNKATNELKDIRGELNKTGRPVEIPVCLDAGDFERGIEEIKGSIIGAAQVLGNVNLGTMEGMADGLVSSFEAVNSEIAKVGNAINGIRTDNNLGFDNISKSIQGATSEVGKFQQAVNSITPPDMSSMTPQMGGYYGGFDQFGHFNMGAMGGSRLLSMMGLGSVSNLVWANASQDDMNTALLKRTTDNPDAMSAKTYGGGGYDIAWAVTQDKTVRRTNLIPGLYSFAMASGATPEDLMGNVFGGETDEVWGKGSGADIIAAFAEQVQLQTGSEVLANSAMFDLSKGFKGQLNSVDQYGVSRETLKAHGYDVDNDNNLQEYLRAVGEIIGADGPNALMSETVEGGLSTLRKRFYNSGQRIGKLFLEPVNDVANLFSKLDNRDFNFMGITIPKQTLSQTLIIATGLTSMIGPLKETLSGLKATFENIKGSTKWATDGIQTLADKILHLGDASKIDAFNEMGAYGILNDQHDRKLHREDYIREELATVQGTRGVHNFEDFEIDSSSMSRSQKRLTKNRKKFDEYLYELEGGMSDTTKADIGRQARAQSKDKKSRNEWTRRAIDRHEYSKLEKMGMDDYIKSELMKDWEAGRKNQISEMSNWGKLKKGVKDSFAPQTTAFTKAFDREKNKSKDGGFFKRLKGNYKGIKEGFSAMKGKGLGDSLGKLKGVFSGLLGAINPVTAVLTAFGVAMAALGGMFVIAYANSETFRNKLGELNTKLHELFDMISFTIGDTLQAMGVTEKGGAEGISEFATKIVDALVSIVDIVNNILMAMTGRDLQQSKEVAKREPEIEKTIQGMKNKLDNGEEISNTQLRTLYNQIDQISVHDPSWLNNWLDTVDPKTGQNNLQKYRLDEMTDVEGTGVGTYLRQYVNSHESGAYQATTERYVDELKYNGIDLSGKTDVLDNALKNEKGEYDKKKIESYNTAKADQHLFDITGGVLGKEWKDSDFAKSNSALQVEMSEERKNRSHGIWDAVGQLINGLKLIGGLVGAILALLIADKAVGWIKKLGGLWKNAGGTTKLGKIGSILKDGLNKALPNLKLGDKLGKLGGKFKDWFKIGDTPLQSKTRDLAKNGFAKNINAELNPSYLDKLKGVFREGGKLESIGNLFRTGGKLESIGNIFSKITGFFGKFSGIFSKITGFFGGIFGKLGLDKIFGKIGFDFIKKIFGKIGFKAIAGTLGKALIGSIPVIGWIIDAVWILLDVLDLLGVPVYDWIWQGLMIAWDWIQKIGGGIWNAICHPLESLKGLFDWIVGGLKGIADGIGKFFEDPLKALEDFGRWIIEVLYEELKKIPIIGDIIKANEWIGGQVAGVFGGEDKKPEDEGTVNNISGGLNVDNSVQTPTEQQVTDAIESYDPNTGKVTVGNNAVVSNNGLNANYTQGGQGINSRMNSGGEPLYGNLQSPDAMNHMNNNQQYIQNSTSGATINNTITVSGPNDEELAKKLANIINTRWLWDAEKGGRTVDAGNNTAYY